MITRPGRWLLAIAAAVLPFAVATTRLELRTDGEALYPSGNRAVEITAEDRRRFRDPEAVVAIVAARAPATTLFTPAGLEKVRSVTEALRGVPGVASDQVLSIASVLGMSTAGERLLVERALPPETAGLSEPQILSRLDHHGLHRGMLYGRDLRSAAIVVPLVADGFRIATVRRLREALVALEGDGFELRLGGPAAAEILLGEQVVSDLARLIPVVVIVVAGCLYLCLRCAGAVAVPLCGMLMVMLGTFGAMAMLGTPLTLVTSTLPVLLMAMSVTDVLHLIERFQAHFVPGAPRAHAVALALAEAGPPIATTTVTTAIGFLSFLGSSVPPMRDFGLFAAIGLGFAMAFSLTLAPALMMTLPAGWWRRSAASAPRKPGRLASWSLARPSRAALLGAAIVAVALAGMPRLAVQDSWVANLAPASDVAAASRMMDEQYHGIYRLDLTLRSDREGAFRSHEGLRLIDSLERVLARDPDVSTTRSLASFANVALEGVGAGRALETLDREGAAQALVLVDMMMGPEVSARFVTPSGREARIQSWVRHADYAKATRLLARVRRIEQEVTARSLGDVHASGDLVVAAEVVGATVSNQLRSVAIALAGLAVVLALAFRSVRICAVLLLPVVAAALIVFGIMGYAGVPLGVATSMFAALVGAEGVAFGVHLVARYREAGGPARADALRTAFATSGSAVAWNTIALVCGCAVLCLSSVGPVRALGALLVLGFLASYLMVVLLLPRLLGSPAPLATARA